MVFQCVCVRERGREKCNDQTVTHSSGQLLVSEYFWMDEGVVVRETSIGLWYVVCVCKSVCVYV